MFRPNTAVHQKSVKVSFFSFSIRSIYLGFLWSQSDFWSICHRCGTTQSAWKWFGTRISRANVLRWSNVTNLDGTFQFIHSSHKMNSIFRFTCSHLWRRGYDCLWHPLLRNACQHFVPPKKIVYCGFSVGELVEISLNCRSKIVEDNYQNWPLQMSINQPATSSWDRWTSGSDKSLRL